MISGFRFRLRGSELLPLTVLCFLLVAVPAIAQTPNVLLILVDDLGIEHLSFYGVGPAPFAPTPNLANRVTVEGQFLRFNNAWSNPVCSPTRASILSGEYGFRTGIGTIINSDAQWGLDVKNLPNLLPQVLKGQPDYETALVGKWHLGTNDMMTGPWFQDQGGQNAPWFGGFDFFQGHQIDDVVSHPNCNKDNVYTCYTETTVVDGNPANVSVETFIGGNTYMTRDTVQNAIDWINQPRTRPWFVYLPLFAPHLPFHCAPPDLNPQTECEPTDSDLVMYHSAIEALDNQIEWLFDQIGTESGELPDNTLVIFTSDNGSPKEVAVSPVSDNRAKGTVYEGGVRVPLLIGGTYDDLSSIVQPGEVDDFVNLSDLFATILEAATGQAPPQGVGEDSESLVGYFDDGLSTPRDFVYTEIFAPNFPGMPAAGPGGARMAVRDSHPDYRKYKLVRQEIRPGVHVEEFYDLSLSPQPFEDNAVNRVNLCSTCGLTQPQLDALTALRDDFELLHGPNGLLDICTLGHLDDSCQDDSDCCSLVCTVGLNTCGEPIY